MAKHTERFDPNSVGPLVEKAKLGDAEATAQLIYQFQRLIVSLLGICTTGKFNPNPRGKHVKFLRYFCSPTTPLSDMAFKIRKQLSMYDLDELKAAANSAAVIAIERSKQNYASTLVIVFAEIVKDMIRDGKINHMDESFMSTLTVRTDEDSILFHTFLSSLSEDEKEWAECIIDGLPAPGPVPKSLIKKMEEFTGLKRKTKKR